MTRYNFSYNYIFSKVMELQAVTWKCNGFHLIRYITSVTLHACYFVIISLLSWEIEAQNSRIIFENKTFYDFWTFAGLTRSPPPILCLVSWNLRHSWPIGYFLTSIRLWKYKYVYFSSELKVHQVQTMFLSL